MFMQNMLLLTSLTIIPGALFSMTLNIIGKKCLFESFYDLHYFLLLAICCPNVIIKYSIKYFLLLGLVCTFCDYLNFVAVVNLLMK
jgi:hypothetical protein